MINTDSTTQKNTSHYTCPLCQNCLQELHHSYVCKQCDRTWPIVNEISRFADEELSYSVFTPEIAEKVTELAEQKNWQEAIDTYSNMIGKYTLGYITNEARADWHIILPLNPEATVLDIGSGWGNIAISLSRWCKQAYCGDVNMINLRLLRTRLRDRKINNVSLFQYEPNAFLRLPFKDSSIDVVLLNGVLEWMGAAEIDATPRDVQLKALKEIKRVLKPGGALYIGIENRCSLAALRGQKIHGELPFIGLLPRVIANAITKTVTGRPHRTYIYTISGYRKLLRQAGLNKIDFYLPYPSYHDPDFLVPLKKPWLKRFWLKQLLGGRSRKYQLADRLGLAWFPFHWLAYSYGIRCIK